MLKELFSYMKQYKKYALISLVCIAAECIFELIIPLIMADMVDVGIANGDQDYILHKGLVMIGCAGLAGAGDLQRTVLRTVRSGLWGESAGSRVPQAAELFLFQYRPFSGVIAGNPPDQ